MTTEEINLTLLILFFSVLFLVLFIQRQIRNMPRPLKGHYCPCCGSQLMYECKVHSYDIHTGKPKFYVHKAWCLYYAGEYGPEDEHTYQTKITPYKNIPEELC